MKVINFYLLAFVVFGSVFTSCGDDEVLSTMQAYESGVLIINEGPFTGGSATLDFYDRSNDLLVRGVFASENEDQVIGSILQSVTIIDDNAFLIVNNSAKIEVVDANSLKYKNTITGVYAPRYMEDLGNGTAVVSEWGANGFSGQLKLVDLSTMTVTDSVAVSGPEQMVVANGNIYVANSGGFGESDKVTVHTLSLEQELELTVGKRVIDMVEDINGDIWVLSGGSYVDEDGASLCQIKNNVVDNCMDLAIYPSDLITDSEGENVYFVESGVVNKIDVDIPTNKEVLNVESLSGTIYGLGYDGTEDALYIGTTPDFSSESTTFVVNENGDLIRSLNTGVLTNGFIAR